jgi:hypothetical protein
VVVANSIFSKAKIIAWRVIGWFLLIAFAIPSIASFIGGDFLVGLIFLAVAFIGCLLTGYKRKKNNATTAPTSAVNHLEYKTIDNEKDDEAAHPIRQPVYQEKTARFPIYEKIKSIKDHSVRADVIEKLITAYQDSYYNGEAEISDREYDLLWDELKYLFPDSPVLTRIDEEPDETPVFHKGRGGNPILDLCAEIESDTNYIPFDPPIPVKIKYRNAEGETTNREIDIQYIAKSTYNDDYYIKAFCRLRGEDRTFKVDRIQQTVADGEIVDIIQYLVYTYRNTDKYKETVQSIKTRNRINSDDILGYSAKILTYIARIDGIFTRKEKITIAHYLKDIDNNQNDIEVEDYIIELGYIQLATPEYKRIVKKTEISEQLIETAKKITGKDPLRLGAFEILSSQYEKTKSKNRALYRHKVSSKRSTRTAKTINN